MVSPRSPMLTALLGRAADYGLPRSFYTDPAYHQSDLDHIFYKEWLFAGHSCEIARPGDYFTLQVGAYPLFVVRGRDQRARAFHNVCRHRGQQLCSSARGSSAKVVCPYHQWTYELDGRLIFARDMRGQIDHGRLGLKPVHCEEVAGYLFISLAETPVDFAPFRAAVEPYMAPHRLTEAKVAFETKTIEQGNWKLVMENNRECYHCRRNHPELCRTFSDRPTLTGVDGVAGDETIAAHWRRCEAMGLPSRFRIAESGQYRTARIPFVDDKESMTMSGRAAVRRLLADFTSPTLGSMLLFHFPTSWNHLLADHAVSFRVLPLGPTESELTTKWLVHREAREGVDYDVKELTEVWYATNEEDKRVVQDNQKGVNSPAYEPGPYSRVHEGGVIQFVDWYSRLMIERLSSRSGTAASAA